MIPIVDLKEQYRGIKDEIVEMVEKVLDSCQFIQGDGVRKFEGDVTRYNRVKYAVAVGNGTDAILLALKAYGIQPNDAVITSTFTYYATAGAIARIGASPIFCDIDPRTYNISAQGIEKVLRDKRLGAKVKAIVPVHLYGQMADMDEILAIAKKYNVKVVEDAAQAFGAEYKGEKAGSAGDAGCFSFYPSKNLGAYGDAGMVVTDDKETADLLRIYSNQGDKGRYQHIVIGHNSRMDSVQAAILRVKLKYIDKWNEQRRSIAKFYDEKLSGVGLTVPFVSKDNAHTYHLYVIRLKGREQKERLEKALNERGIDARTYYPVPLHLQECFNYLGYKKGDFPEAERAAEETVAIPIYPELTKEQQEFIIDTIRKALGIQEG